MSPCADGSGNKNDEWIDASLSETLNVTALSAPMIKEDSLASDMQPLTSATCSPAEASTGGVGADPLDAENITKRYPNGSVYIGKLVNGRHEGYGVWEAPSGQGRYDGQWHDGVQHGEGHQIWEDGREYRGGFNNGMYHGHGKMTWQDSSGTQQYEGEYHKNLKHGKGKFLFGDGRSHEGQWKDGKRTGPGIYINSKGKSREGIWKEDKLESLVDGVIRSVDGGA